jgi:hypothetical protein
MSLAGTLLSLDRLRHQVPGSLAATSRRLGGGALSNARLALEGLTGGIEDRRQLLEDLDEGTRPGHLYRLSRETCLELLASQQIGRLAYIARAGVPDIVPVNYVLAGESLLIRSAPGPKLQAAQRRERVAFEIDGIDEESHTAWSVVVSGLASVLSASDAPMSHQPVPWAAGPRRHTLRIDLLHVDGRQLL